jgi:DNA-directed RNA polymerase beta' subunit
MTVGDKLCVTADHAVLTREGWKFVDKITLEDEILTLNPTTQKTEYQQPVELHFYPEGGDMYKVESSEVDLFVTTDHKMYASENDGFFKIIPAKNVYGKRVRYKSLEGVTKKIAPNEESLIKNCKEPVYCFEVPNHIFYIKRNGKAVWTSNCGRHGNKSIVGTILPDNLMPRGEDGKPLDLIHNSSGIASRINVGQILETAASKIARKTGKPYVVDNFSPEKYNYSEKIRQDLKKHGLKDTERVYDPSLGKYLQEEPLVGEQFFIKQRHQVEKKLSVRGMDNQKYTINLSPRGGGDVGAQAIGQLEFYALLAHGARHNLKEIATYKADKQVDDKLQDTDFWLKVQLGIPLPPPKPTFAYKKFEAMLTGLGINLHKAGNDVILQPLTDKGVLKMGTGEISNAHQVRGKDDKEMVGGLFDPKLTGGVPNGVGKGQLWSYIKLAEPMPNPVFTGSKQLPGPAAVLTGLKWDEFNAIVKGTKHIDINGKSLTGGHAVNELLKKVNVEKELEATLKKLPHLKDAELNKENRKAKYLQALSKLKMRPEEAYMMNYVPVLPPIFRPIVPMEDGTIRHSDITELYKKLILVNNKLKDKEVNKYMPEVEQKLREETFDILKASLGVGTMPTYDGNRKLKGLLQTIAGDSPKMGFFQDKIMKRRQELSMRSTIIPAQDMGIDEVGIPKDAAMELYKPFVIRELVYRGKDLLEAKKEIKEKTPIALKALDRVITERPVLLKRDPVLHKYNVQAFMPKLIEGSAIQLHGLNCGAFNSDFDGDTMAAYLPLTEEARREALEKMLPSKNLFSSTHYGILHAPEQEAVIGLHLLTNWGTKKNKVYDSKAKILADKELKPSDVVSFVEKGKPKETTKGRLLLASHLPEAFQTPELLYSPSYSLKKKSIHEILENIAKSSPHEYPTMVNKLRNLGSNTAHEMGFTFSMKDLTPLTGLRDSILKPYGDEEARIRKQHNLSEEEQDAKIVALYTDATKKLDTDIHKAYADKNDNNIFKMVKTKARGSDASLRQMLIAPMLLVDTNGKVIPTPVTRSYSEGLTISDYWTTLHGARKGVIDRAQGTARPGALAKELVNLSITTLINKDDCGTTKGHRVPVIDKLGGEEIDITDRLLAKDHPELGLKKDQLVTPEVYSKLKEAGHKYVEVRSALNCALPHGVCSKCMGLSQDGRLHEIGTNIGVIASQALSEPATQLSMDTIGKKSMVTVLINNEIQTISVEHLWDLV